jgi:hypothetical protein
MSGVTFDEVRVIRVDDPEQFLEFFEDNGMDLTGCLCRFFVDFNGNIGKRAIHIWQHGLHG